MNRKYRLKKTEHIKRVRLLGESFAHPLIVLFKHPNNVSLTRFGIVAGKPLGNAVNRNRRKRQLREILRSALPSIKPGWDIIILLRNPSAVATFEELLTAVNILLKRANLLITTDAQ